MLENNRRIINKTMGCSEKDAANNCSMQIYLCKQKNCTLKKPARGPLFQDENILIKIHMTQQCFFRNNM